MWSLFFLTLFALLLSSCTDTKSEDVGVLIEEVQHMRQCQRKAENRDFYLHKYKADKIIARYKDNFNSLSPELQKLFIVGRSGCAFTYTDYLIQIGDRDRALQVMDDLSNNTTLNLNSDTTLWLNYLSHQALVRYIPYDIRQNKQNILKGYDCLMQSYILSTRNNIGIYKAVSLQLLSKYLLNDSIFSLVKSYDAASLRYINEDGVGDGMLACNLAERAVDEFSLLHEPYLAADAWRNLAFCHFVRGDAERAIECLNMALANPTIDSMPALRAEITEQLSMSYAAIDDKHMSDTYRNLYLDLQDSTRQDRQLEARAIELKHSTTRIWIWVVIAFAVFILLCCITLFLFRLRRRTMQRSDAQEEELELLRDKVRAIELQYSDAQRAAVEQRARIEIIIAMLPLIDRMKLSIEKGYFDYAREIAESIEKQNAMLTRWIKLRQGKISPRIENFPLQDIFSMLKKNAALLSKQDITLTVQDTDATVKADKSLTLFLLNTLVDNARKAVNTDSSEPLHINIACRVEKNAAENFAEIEVRDNGCGMTEEQVAHLFEYKPIIDHGFGLQNCRGIIDKYRKLSAVFSVCNIKAESEQDKGTAIIFRLPIVVKLLLGFLFLLPSSMCLANEVNSDIERLTDSLYSCNVTASYDKAMQYGDSCVSILKQDSLVRKDTRLSVYNEIAVAALALHQWQKYLYYNYLYSVTYKQYTTDATLPDYCTKMEQYRLWANISMLIVLMLTLSLIPVFWFVYLRHVIQNRKQQQARRSELQEQYKRIKREFDRLHIINNIADNQLSTVKHETMYYPSRIMQIIKLMSATSATGESTSNTDIQELLGIIKYYRELYAMLSTKVLQQQVSKFSFPLSKCRLVDLLPDIKLHKQLAVRVEDITVFINRELFSFFRVLLKRHNAGVAPACECLSCSSDYVTLSFSMHRSELSSSSLSVLFTPDTLNADYLVLRQILREIGNASNHYGCGITASYSNRLCIEITLPT